MKVLLLEDDEATRLHIAKALGAAGHVVDLCDKGQDAIFLGLSNTYAVLILDRMVPGINGLGVLKPLRAAGISTPHWSEAGSSAAFSCVASIRPMKLPKRSWPATWWSGFR